MSPPPEFLTRFCIEVASHAAVAKRRTLKVPTTLGSDDH